MIWIYRGGYGYVKEDMDISWRIWIYLWRIRKYRGGYVYIMEDINIYWGGYGYIMEYMDIYRGKSYDT